MSVRTRTSGTARPDFTRFSVRATHSRGPVILCSVAIRYAFPVCGFICNCFTSTNVLCERRRDFVKIELRGQRFAVAVLFYAVKFAYLIHI